MDYTSSYNTLGLSQSLPHCSVSLCAGVSNTCLSLRKRRRTLEYIGRPPGNRKYGNPFAGNVYCHSDHRNRSFYRDWRVDWPVADPRDCDCDRFPAVLCFGFRDLRCCSGSRQARPATNCRFRKFLTVFAFLLPVFCCLRPAFSPMRWVLCCLCPRFGGLRRFQSVVGWPEAVKYPFRRVVLVPGRLGPDPVLVPDRVGGAARPAGARRRAVPLLMVISKRLIPRRRTATGWALKTGSDWQ